MDPTAEHRGRYLRLLKDALLDRHYLDNEVRLEYLLGLPAGTAPDLASLRDPSRTLEVRYKRLEQGRRAGRSSDGPRGDAYTPYTDMGVAALDHLTDALIDVHERGVPGDLLECGVGRGGGGIALRATMDAYGIAGRSLWMVDQYLATDGLGIEGEPAARARLRADLNQVRDGFARFDVLDDRVRFLQGDLDASLDAADIGPLALVRVGVDAAFNIGQVLSRVLPKASPGATIIVEGVGRPVIAERLETFRQQHEITDQLHQVDWNTVAWQVGRSPEALDAPPAAHPGHRVPLAPQASATIDLSVVVVFYDMTRESARTLRSLSRSYQRGIEDLDYEVIVIDNGSHPEHRLDAAQVASYGPEFRLITLTDAPSTPTVALNHGIAQARGQAVALMIDGAHVLTPGVFQHALAAMGLYDPAVVAIQQWYVGPGQQGDAQQAGYDQEAEDRLFRTIGWPTDGYRLFEIGHFIGDRDWFDGIIESNCLFVPRSLLEQVGGFDDSFDMAGGGYANLELFERLHGHPTVTPATVLGEGSFHQFHGGTTTNVADEAVRRQRVFSYGEHFRETRGRGLMGLNKPVRYVGSMDTKAARRTRSRYEYLLAFDRDRDPVGSTGADAQPVPEQLKFAAIEAIWNHQTWREATWLGEPVARYPTDLHAYQELMSQVRPDVVLLVSDDVGVPGRALHAASVLDQLGHGEVIIVRAAGAPPVRPHPRITDLGPEASADPNQVRALVGDRGALVFIGLGANDRVGAAFEAYAPLVPVGGYAVIENTVVNGRPAAPAFGPGPHEAVMNLLQRHHDFVPDAAFERYTITFNKHGYLRRMPTS